MLKKLTYLSLILVSATALAVLMQYPTNKETDNTLLFDGQVLGSNSQEADAKIDFSKQIATSPHLIFGGAHAPRLTDEKAWDEIQAAGFTSVRLDFFLDRYVPPRITLQQYKDNVGNVQDPQNWNQVEINKVKGVYQEARRRNMKVFGILAYSVPWLTNNNSNYGVPVDWDVYDDIVEKSYRIYRDDLDYLEIWNEPDMDVFLDVKSSGLTKDQAYLQIVKRSIAVIRKVDAEINDGKRMKIGVGVMSQPTNTYILETLFKDKSLHKEFDFISYHNYEHIIEPADVPVRLTMEKHGLGHLPIYLTEWAHSPHMKKPDSFVLNDQAISYSGQKLIDYMKMGLAGANYFAIKPIIPDSPRGDEGYLGFYTGKDQNTAMLPIIKTWYLMSRTLGLGTGENRVFGESISREKVVGWQNADEEYGMVISNITFDNKAYNVTLENLPFDDSVVATAYIASSDTNGREIAGSTLLRQEDGKIVFRVLTPPNAVVGIIFHAATWRDKLLF